MFCFWRTSALAVLLIWGVFVAGSSCTDKNQTTQNNSSVPVTVVNTTMSVQMGKKALLCCLSIPLTKAVLITWIIKPRGLPSCTIAYKVDTKTNETSCLGRNITWASTPDHSPELQISAVALQHEGTYTCETVTPEGNFEKVYDLQVLVPPEVTYFPGKNRTVVCEAIAGKPAAHVSWTPDGDCVTESESHSNGTVTVRSMCHWEQNNVSAVSCVVSHSTGNQSLFIELSRGGDQSLPYISYIIPSIIILIIIGCICLLKISDFRKCKLPKSEATSAVEEDEMQPYASYTEKSNPLYDTVTKVEAFPVSQGEVNGTDCLTL